MVDIFDGFFSVSSIAFDRERDLWSVSIEFVNGVMCDSFIAATLNIQFCWYECKLDLDRGTNFLTFDTFGM